MPGTDKIKRLIVLMAKQPKPGRTKTRLTPPLSPSEAAELYECFLSDKFDQMRQVPIAQPAIAYWPESARDYFMRTAPEFTLLEQSGSDLPARLRNMFAQAFDRGYQQVMAIDGDTPNLPPAYLKQGFLTLDDPTIDVILGPCDDGGYYAIAMKEPHSTLFDVKMSTPNVSKDTLAQAAEAKLNVECLPTWHDVDWPEDLDRLKEELSGDEQQNTATARFLARMSEQQGG